MTMERMTTNDFDPRDGYDYGSDYDCDRDQIAMGSRYQSFMYDFSGTLFLSLAFVICVVYP